MDMRIWKIAGLMAAVLAAMPAVGPAVAAEPNTPQYKVEPFWPKLLPNTWAFGVLAGVIADKADNIWIIQRPKTVEPYLGGGATTPPTAACCMPAPPVVAFNQDGDVVKSWGGPSKQVGGEGYEWPSSEHGIAVDPKGNIWIGGNATRTAPDGSPADGQILKFTPDGKFLLQIGHAGPSKGSLDTTQMSGVSDLAFDEKSNEVFVADGYGNHRIIVFDMDTGKFKRMWGAYGNKPNDDKETETDDIGPDKTKPLPQQFNTVHCVAIAKDGLVYVCDRQHNRIQVFKKDGTFVQEFIYPGSSFGGTPGRVADMAIWTDKQQSYLVVDDGNYEMVRLVDRFTGDPVTSFGRPGNYAGQFNRLHVVAVDSEGSIFAGEAGAHRVQKFIAIAGAPSK
jgi:hypothetical protein